MAPHKSPFTRVDDLLQKTLKDLNLEETFQVYPLWKQWTNIVGPAIANKTHPDFIRGKTLIVSVENSTWLNELEMQKTMILSKINESGLTNGIQEIRFRMKQSDET